MTEHLIARDLTAGSGDQPQHQFAPGDPARGADELDADVSSRGPCALGIVGELIRGEAGDVFVEGHAADVTRKVTECKPGVTVLRLYQNGSGARLWDMDINEIRRKNLKFLVNRLGGPTKFALHTARDRSQISQLISGKNIGLALARRLEQQTGQPKFWMDHEHPDIWGESDDQPAALPAPVGVSEGTDSYLPHDGDTALQKLAVVARIIGMPREQFERALNALEREFPPPRPLPADFEFPDFPPAPNSTK